MVRPSAGSSRHGTSAFALVRLSSVIASSVELRSGSPASRRNEPTSPQNVLPPESAAGVNPSVQVLGLVTLAMGKGKELLRLVVVEVL